MNHPLVSRTLFTSLAVLAILSSMNSSLNLQSARLSFPSQDETHVRLPSAEIAKTAALNYQTAAADLLYIRTVIDHAMTLHRENRVSNALGYNVRQIVEIDPRFYTVYEWYSAANLNRRTNVSEEDLLRTNEVLDIGIEAFPTDAELPYTAGMNFMGYSDPSDTDRRRRELNRAVDYLQESLSRPNAPPNIPLVIGWMKDRLRKMADGEKTEGLSRESEIEFNRRLYLMTQDPQMRESIEKNLKALGAEPDELFNEDRERQQLLLESHERDTPYIPLNLWLSIGADLSTREAIP